MDDLRTLAALRAPGPVLSVHLRTDPRDPANTAHVPGWRVEAMNGLRRLQQELEERADRMALRSLRDRLERELEALPAQERGRGLSWFLADGFERRFTHRLPLAADVVRWDERPFISPLADVLDRGRETGIVLVSGERVRMLHWAHGRVDEAGDEILDLRAADWRPYAAYASANPARGQQTATHVDHFAARLDEHRGRFLDDAARGCARRLDERGWRRVVLAAEGQVAARFREALPQAVAARTVAELELNAVGDPAPEVAERITPLLDELARREGVALAERLTSGGGGEPVAVGPPAALAALAEHRVEHLVLDPFHVPYAGPLPPAARDLMDGAPAGMIAERAVESAVAGGARVTVVRVADSGALAGADGIVAALRW